MVFFDFVYITQYTNQGGVAWVYPFFEEKILIFDFWATIWSQRPQNTSPDSLDVSLQDSKKISCSHHFLKFFGPRCKGRPCKKRKMALPRPLWTGLKIGCRTKNIDFFKVRDMLTIIWPRKKEHLTNVSSPLKTFYDHLRGRRDNLNFFDFWDFWYAYICTCAYFYINACIPKISKIQKIQIISATA